MQAYTGEQPVRHAISLNMQRRHLSPEQREAITLRLRPQIEAERAQRKQANLVPTKAGEKVGSAQHKARATDGATLHRQLQGTENQDLTGNLLDEQPVVVDEGNLLDEPPNLLDTAPPERVRPSQDWPEAVGAG